ncbi:ABC transporter permease subunit [Nocardioides sp. B-3]|uniref:ABC transporter permease subunit n=1 Tax=Nocardioides sp. B-3 TaxID=2895565 RepID=UPI002152D4D6|nr:hypothetical protein [Nocardioides sp. B-3]UUZ58022.1 hypothetical protein LP418_17075 [Nocardioides sp. B-3]
MFLAVVVGSLMIALTDEDVRASASYVFARPGDFFRATWDAIWGAYTALFRGSVYNDRVDTFAGQIRPLTETLKFAGPLIAAGLGVGLAFRAALFNIGGRGQMLLAGAASGWVAFKFDLPLIVHLPLAILAGMVAGAMWAGIAGSAEGPHGRPRGDRDDHAQLRRLLPRLLRAVAQEPPAGSRFGQPRSRRRPRSRRSCRRCWATSSTCTSASCSRSSRSPSCGGCSTVRPSATASVLSGTTPTPPAPRASTSA